MILQGSQSLIYFKIFFFEQIELCCLIRARGKEVLDLVQLQEPLDENQQQAGGKQQSTPAGGVKVEAGKEIFSHK